MWQKMLQVGSGGGNNTNLPPLQIMANIDDVSAKKSYDNIIFASNGSETTNCINSINDFDCFVVVYKQYLYLFSKEQLLGRTANTNYDTKVGIRPNNEGIYTFYFSSDYTQVTTSAKITMYGYKGIKTIENICVGRGTVTNAKSINNNDYKYICVMITGSSTSNTDGSYNGLNFYHFIVPIEKALSAISDSTKLVANAYWGNYYSFSVYFNSSYTQSIIATQDSGFNIRIYGIK